MRHAVTAIPLILIAIAAPANTPGTPGLCSVGRPVWAGPTDDPAEVALAGGWWYMNSNRTIWAGSDAAGMTAGPLGNKVAWLRPKGEQLVVSTRRLDADTAPGEADTPCCYGGRFQASGMTFPSGGCWEISAHAGSEMLKFVTYVSGNVQARDAAQLRARADR